MLKRFKSIAVLTAVTLVLATLSFYSGCKPSTKKIEKQQAKLEQKINATFDEITKLESEQKYADADALITALLGDNNFADNKERLIAKKAELLLKQDKTAEAEELVLTCLKEEPEVVQGALETIFNYYRNNKLFDKCITLSGKILNLGSALPSGILANVLGERFGAAVESGDADIEKSSLGSIMSSVKESALAIRIIQPHMITLIRKKKYSEAMGLTKYMEDTAGSDDNYKNLAAFVNIQCVVASQNWAQLKPVYTSCIKQLPDGELSKLMRYVFTSLSKAKMNDLLKECSQIGMSESAGKQKSTDYAARKWVEACFAEDKSSLPGCISSLQGTKVSANQIASIFDSHFYEVASDKKLIRELCAIGSKLIPKCTDENITNALKVKILDGAFIVEDYDLAISMLEKGIPGKDAAWHAMSLPKVKAHRAQAQNKPREAVKYYREFMDCWKNGDKEEEFDPTSGIAYSKEWILARNAARIASILDSIPDKAEAAKARDEAKAYFKIAIEKAKDDEAALKLVKEEAAKLK